MGGTVAQNSRLSSEESSPASTVAVGDDSAGDTAAVVVTDTAAKPGTRVVSLQNPHGCTVRETACKEGITKMDSIIRIAGIDVSKDKLDVHVLASNLDFVVSRDRRGLSGLASRLRKAGVGDVALEASGGYERAVIERLEASGFVVHLLDPARVRHFGEAIGKLAKTDPIDARLIASYCWHFPQAGLVRRPEQARKLGEFLSVRRMLRKVASEAGNQLEHLSEPTLRALVEGGSRHGHGQAQDHRWLHCRGHRRG